MTVKFFSPNLHYSIIIFVGLIEKRSHCRSPAVRLSMVLPSRRRWNYPPNCLIFTYLHVKNKKSFHHMHRESSKCHLHFLASFTFRSICTETLFSPKSMQSEDILFGILSPLSRICTTSPMIFAPLNMMRK